MRPAVYISVAKDIDLYGLARDMGLDEFRKVVKLCVMGLFEEKYAAEAKKLAMECRFKRRDASMQAVLKERDGVLSFRICVSGSKMTDRQCGRLLSSIKPRFVSFFIKTTVRQVLGPEVLLHYFLGDEKITFHPNSFFIPLSFISAEDGKESVKKRKRRIKGQPANPETAEEKTGIVSSAVPEEEHARDKNATEKLHTDGYIRTESAVKETGAEPPSETGMSLREENKILVSEAETDDDGMDILDMLESML